MLLRSSKIQSSIWYVIKRLIYSENDIKILSLAGSPILEFVIYAINEIAMYCYYKDVL